MYILAQVLGSTLASLTLRMLFREQGNIQPIVNQYSDPTSDLEAIVWEFIITFILMFTICGVATDPRAVWSELHLMLASKIFYINDEKMGLQNRSDVFLLFLLCFYFSPYPFTLFYVPTEQRPFWSCNRRSSHVQRHDCWVNNSLAGLATSATQFCSFSSDLMHSF